MNTETTCNGCEMPEPECVCLEMHPDLDAELADPDSFINTERSNTMQDEQRNNEDYVMPYDHVYGQAFGDDPMDTMEDIEIVECYPNPKDLSNEELIDSLEDYSHEEDFGCGLTGSELAHFNNLKAEFATRFRPPNIDEIDTTTKERVIEIKVTWTQLMKAALIGAILGLLLAWAYGADEAAAAKNTDTNSQAWVTVQNPSNGSVDRLKVTGDNDAISIIAAHGYNVQAICPKGKVPAEDYSCVSSDFYSKTDYNPVSYTSPVDQQAPPHTDPSCIEPDGRVIPTDGCLAHAFPHIAPY